MKKNVFLNRTACFISLLSFIVFLLSCQSREEKLTRGIGVYPGNPAEEFAPELKSDNSTYRNLALLRPAYHSSSYDYNLTAQLVTDGIVTTEIPDFISLSTNQGLLPKNEREWLFDHVTGSGISINGTDVWLQLELGGTDIPEVSQIAVNGDMTYDEKKPAKWNFTVSGSEDGINWTELDQTSGSGLPGKEKVNAFYEMLKKMRKDKSGKNPFTDFFGPSDPNAPKPSFTFTFREPEKTRELAQTFELKTPVAYRYYRVNLNASSAKTWKIGDFDFFNQSGRIEMAPSHRFKSAWMSAGTGKEWVYVDLGNRSSFDHVKLHWINKAKSGIMQVSDDAKTWTEVAQLPETPDQTDDIALKQKTKGRYVRILMNQPNQGKRYILSELEVMGKGGLVPVPRTAPVASNNRMDLAGGKWKIQRASEVQASGEQISQTGFDNNWIVATVPGTALVSYWNAGAIPNPNFGDNQLMISESFFYDDFWYRDEFVVPKKLANDRMFLNFDGINWKADVFVNGKKAGRIEGAFIRGQFDVTNLIVPGKENAIAVLIHKNDHPGTIKEQTAISPDKNGGVLGADNPTYHASVGWDWIPTIRGRNIGIWNDVYLTSTGPVTIEEPFVTTDLPLPDTTSADIRMEVTLQNHDTKTVTGKLEGKYGDIPFEKEVTLEANSSKVVNITPGDIPALHIENPKLWWPKGYGAQNLYEVELSFVTNQGAVSDKTHFKSGVREIAFDETNQILSLYINGRRFIGRGGNWGFPESNLEYRGREYDIAVGYHADMNFTMIRNWVGQTGDDEFYDACDKYGIMVWQDFWLANPVDGPNPDNPSMFMKNARDMVKRIRNHPSIAIYVGRNEGNPPEVLDTALRAMVKELHPGIHYIPNSSMGVVSGGGPYRALPVRDYFLLYGKNKFHSERGMPNVMTFESLEQTLPDSALWPQNSMWGLHDYCLEGAQGAASFNKIIETAFGPIDNAKKFTELAQWINYDGYRGMFEGRSEYRKGLLLWMSHPAWPSMVWQTYDYYFEPTAAYFGCKKASEPIHIQWNPVYDTIEVVNYSAGNLAGLTAKAQLINMDGAVQWEKEAMLNSNEDTTDKLFKLEFPESLSSVHFIKLTLKKDDKVLSDNFYWRGLEQGNYQALNQLPKAEIENQTTVQRDGDNWVLETRLSNTSSQPALMLRLKAVGKKTGERILPVLYSDNYISLMPGESRTILTRVKREDCRREMPEIEISGFNL